MEEEGQAGAGLWAEENQALSGVFLFLQAKCIYVVLEWLKSNEIIWKEGKKTEQVRKKEGKWKKEKTLI